jgi:hypothetical protein
LTILILFFLLFYFFIFAGGREGDALFFLRRNFTSSTDTFSKKRLLVIALSNGNACGKKTLPLPSPLHPPPIPQPARNPLYEQYKESKRCIFIEHIFSFFKANSGALRRSLLAPVP